MKLTARLKSGEGSGGSTRSAVSRWWSRSGLSSGIVGLGGLGWACFCVCARVLRWTWVDLDGAGRGGGVAGPDPHDKQTSKRVHENRLTSSLRDRGLCGNKLRSDNFVA